MPDTSEDVLPPSWAEVLRGAPLATDLPTDRPRPARSILGTAVVVTSDPAATVAGSRHHALIAALGTLVHRYSGQEDVVLALVDGADSGRPLRLHLDETTTWESLEPHVAQAIEHGVDAGPLRLLAPSSAVTEHARAHVAIAYGDATSSADGAFDLVLTVRADEIVWTYRCDLYDESTVQRMADHLARLLERAVADPQDPVDALELLSASERHQLLVEWNDTTVPFSEQSTIVDLVERQVARTPDAAAVEFGTTVLTYRELHRAVRRLSAHLVDRGVQPGDLVGVLLERSHELVVVVLAVLHAGGAYVPLDPNFPPDRLALMVEDSGLQTLVTQTTLVGVVDAPGVAIVDLDNERDRIEARPDSSPDTEGAQRRSSRDLAYVIYTSGSTGRPKGVMLEHRSVVNFLESMSRTPGLQPGARLLAVTTLSFDIAGLELFGPLVSGGTVVVAARSTTTDPHALAAALEAHRIDVMQATPATWRMLVDARWEGRPGLTALCGGEALPRSLAQDLQSRVEVLWNLYGPTETTIWSTVQRVEPDAAVSIGRPIDNTTLYVLDRTRNPVPIGVAGELLIGGDGLARGYRGLPELTADRFVPDPFRSVADDAPAPRMYRTGDLVRYRPDGRIEFLGRIDHQVKVRGFRIELGEIETVLGRHPAVDETVVVARPDTSGETRLVAYVTLRAEHRAPVVAGPEGITDAPVTAAGLRRSVQSALPHYMVPSLVVFLDAMPRTPNGKTDRASMPDPDWGAIARETPYVEPRDDTERTMVQLWEETLGIDDIGVFDDFFELGVESLVAARLFGRIERAFSTVLPVGTVFANPTVAALSAVVRDAQGAAPKWPSLVAIHDGGNRRTVFGVHGGAGTVLLYGELARRLGNEGHDFYGLQAQGLYGHHPVHNDVATMAAAYVDQIREVQPDGPYALVGYCFGALVAFEMAQRLRAGGDGVDVLVSVNGPSPGYIRRHDPDGQFADDEQAPSTPRPAVPTVPLAMRARLRLRKYKRRYLVNRSIRRGVELPEKLRENRVFQALSVRAQGRYEPERYGGRIVVLRAPNLYVESDLGWGDLCSDVVVHEVPGHQPIARWTMKEPTVGFVAERLSELLADTPQATAVRG